MEVVCLQNSSLVLFFLDFRVANARETEKITTKRAAPDEFSGIEAKVKTTKNCKSLNSVTDEACAIIAL